MLAKSRSLYRKFPTLAATVLFLAACANTPPHQALSEATQMYKAATLFIHDAKNTATLTDKSHYQLAGQALKKANNYMAAQNYAQASQWTMRSKTHSQRLLIKQHDKLNNIFKY